VSRVARLIATGFGVGYVPAAPGTAGSLLALPFLPWLAALRDASVTSYAALVLGVVVLAIWSAGRAAAEWNVVDDQRIVADEIAGMAVAGSLLPASWTAAVLAFAWFRLFDVWKPAPIRQLEKRLPGGLGVVTDDLLAGIYAGVAARVVLALATSG
jgi:phosphatidylglycerophosphatase A